MTVVFVYCYLLQQSQKYGLFIFPELVASTIFHMKPVTIEPLAGYSSALPKNK
jgi:hypothetical protein